MRTRSPPSGPWASSRPRTFSLNWSRSPSATIRAMPNCSAYAPTCREPASRWGEKADSGRACSAEPHRATGPPRNVGHPRCWQPSKHPQRQPGPHRLPQRPALLQLSCGNPLGRQDGFGGLGVGADDQGLGHGLEAPAGGDAGDLAGGVLAVAARADEAGIRPAIAVLQRRVVAAVGEVLELPADGGWVFGGGEEVPAGGQPCVGAGRGVWPRGPLPALACGGWAGGRAPGYWGGAPGQGGEDDREGFLWFKAGRRNRWRETRAAPATM